MLKVRHLLLHFLFYSSGCIILCKLVLMAVITYICGWHAETTEAQFNSQFTYTPINNNKKKSCTMNAKESWGLKGLAYAI